MKNKAIGFYFACVSALLTAVTLVITLMYSSRGGQVNTLAIVALAAALVCEISLFFGEKAWTDFAGIIAAALLTFSLMRVLTDGIWNIAESISGIKMVGLPELAGMNYAMIGLGLAAILVTIISCFMKKSK